MDTNKTRYAIILGMLAALGPLCTDFYLPALPEVASHLHTSTSLSQLTLTASLIGLGVGQLVFGPISDAVGRKKPLLISLLLFILSSLWCALAPNLSQLLLARLVQGISGAGGAVISRAIARDRYNGIELTRFFAVLMAVNGIAPVLAPVLGGAQLMITGWQGLFVTLAVIGLLLALLSGFGIQESHHPQRGQGESTWYSMAQVLKDKVFMAMCFTQGFMLAGLFAYIGASAYVFQDIYQLSAQQFSYIFATNGIGLIVFSLISARLAERFSEKRVLQGTLLIAWLAALLFMGLSIVNAPFVFILLTLFVTISINSATCTILGSLAMQRQGKRSGAASALLGVLMFLLGGVAAPLTGIGGTSLCSMALVILLGYLLAGSTYFLWVRQAVAD